MKKTTVIIGILLILTCIWGVSAENQVIVGTIIDETGDSALFAPGIKAAINLAISDLNESYEKAGMDMSVRLIIAGSDGTKDGAAAAGVELVTQGVDVIVLPSTSEEVSGMLPLLNREGIISVNPSSSTALSSPGNPIVRLCPDDHSMLRAVEKHHQLIERTSPALKIVVLARDDLYGKVLGDGGHFCSHVVDTIMYPQNTRDFMNTLEELDATVADLIEEVGEDSVIVSAISFDEIADILAQASAYPNLQKVHWEGLDVVALNSAVLMNETAAEFAYTTGLTAVSFNIAQPESSDYWRVYDAVKSATGKNPGIYEILPYDCTLMAVWIMQNNPSDLAETLYIADSFGKYSYGATGWLKLNENSDREYGDYYFYQVTKSTDGEYRWVPVKAYMYQSDSIISLDGVDNIFMRQYQ